MKPVINATVAEREDNYSGFYIGTVVKQCENSGACKVFVYGVYPDEYKDDPEQLPTAYPCMPLWGGGRSENSKFPNGIYQYPDLNTTVLVFFASNDINKPYFFAMMDHDKKMYDNQAISIHYGKCYIELRLGGDMTIYADRDIDIEAGRNINIVTGSNLTTNVGGNKTEHIADTYSISTANKYGVRSDNGITMVSPYMKLLTEEGFFGTIKGDGRVTVNSGSVKSGSGRCYVGPYIKVMKI